MGLLETIRYILSSMARTLIGAPPRFPIGCVAGGHAVIGPQPRGARSVSGEAGARVPSLAGTRGRGQLSRLSGLQATSRMSREGGRRVHGRPPPAAREYRPKAAVTAPAHLHKGALGRVGVHAHAIDSCPCIQAGGR